MPIASTGGGSSVHPWSRDQGWVPRQEFQGYRICGWLCAWMVPERVLGTVFLKVTLLVVLMVEWWVLVGTSECVCWGLISRGISSMVGN